MRLLRDPGEKPASAAAARLLSSILDEIREA